MISQTGKYALHVLGFLAKRREEMITGEEIAAATGVPANYLSKILSQLRKHGIVDSRKGWGGGFRVRTGALDRPIRDVLVILDGLERIERKDCVFGLDECNLTNPCPLHHHWESIRSSYEKMLAETRVADLAAD